MGEGAVTFLTIKSESYELLMLLKGDVRTKLGLRNLFPALKKHVPSQIVLCVRGMLPKAFVVIATVNDGYRYPGRITTELISVQCFFKFFYQDR